MSFDKNNIILILKQKGSLNTFIACRVPGELGSVVGIVIFYRIMRLNSVNVAMEMVLTELPSSNVHVKYS